MMTTSRGHCGSFLFTFCVLLGTFRLHGVDADQPTQESTIRLVQDLPISPVEGSYVILSDQMIKVLDNTSLCLDCTITIIPTANSTGRFANITESLTEEISEFTFEELANREVVFVVDVLGGILQYSQPVEISSLLNDDQTIVESTLNISIVPLSISASFQPIPDTNCLQTLDLLTSAMIQLSSNSLIVTLDQSQRLPEVTVDVIVPPSFGTLGHKETNQSLLSTFSYTLFIEEQIVYTIDDNTVQKSSDSFDVRLSIGHGVSEVVTVTLCINSLPYPMLTHLNTLSVYVTGQTAFSPEFLKATQTRLLDSAPQDLIFHVISTPTNGLILDDHTSSSVSSVHSFTQEQVNNGKVFYVNKRADETNMTDRFQFRLGNKYYRSDNIFTALITLKKNELTAINNGFTVMEGGNHTITSSELSVLTPSGYSLQEVSVYILDYPDHGTLLLKRPDPAPIVTIYSVLSLNDILQGYLTYNHSGDEGISDLMTVLFIARKEGSVSLDLPFMVNITIVPVNNKLPVKVYSKELKVIEKSSQAITTKNLKYIDYDYNYDSDNLVYVLRYSLFQGELCLDGECKEVEEGFSWRQGDMNGNLVYKHTGAIGLDFLLFSVYDDLPENGGLESMDSGLLAISVSSVMPVRTKSDPVIVQENFFGLIGPQNIDFTSPGGISPSEFSYTIIEKPKRGYIFATNDINSPIRKFTQSDVNEYTLLYYHDGSNSVTDSFKVELDVRSFQSEYTIDISILPVNDDPPQLAVHEKIFVDFMKPVHLNRSQLLIQDEDTPEANLLEYIVTSDVTHGKLEKRDDTNSQEFSKASSFTQKDINDLNVRYTHTHPHANQNFLDSFTFKISDGVQQAGPYNTSIYILPDRVPISVAGATVNEGATVTLSLDSIDIQHPYFAGTNGRVSIPELVQHGSLKIDGEMCIHCDFDTDDLAKGKIQYTHSGDEDKFDVFRFFIEWQGLLRTDYKNYTITILPVNDQKPTIVRSSGLTLWATEIVTLTPFHLLTEDNDSPPDKIVYKFDLEQSQQQEGHFSFVGTPKQVNHTFTQDDINNGLVTFVDTHYYEGSTRHLKFTVTDGKFVSSGRFNVTAWVVALTTVSNNGLSVEMGGEAMLTNKELSHITNNEDINGSMISYHIEDGGFKYGNIVDSNGKTRTSFTQAEIDTGLLSYRHIGVDIWEAKDSANITVHAPLLLPRNIRTITLCVGINIINESSPLALNNPLSVTEGGMACLNSSSLDGRNVRYNAWKANPGNVSLDSVMLNYVMTTPPLHGQLLLNDTVITQFSNSDILTGMVCYHSDGSENDKDEIMFDTVVTTEYQELERIADTMHINIKLVNDEKPYLVTGSPHLTVIKGFWHPITSKDLRVTDGDNPPSEKIKYTVEPNSVHPDNALRLGQSNTPVLMFTQADIDNGYLMFLSNKTGNTSFVFEFDDHYHPAERKTFHITVQEHVVEFIVKNSILTFHQTDQEGVITSAIANTMTNGYRHLTQYFVTVSPSYGEIIVDGKPSNTFSQLDVDNRAVRYRLTKFESSRDHLSGVVSNMNVANASFSINIIVETNAAVAPNTILPSHMSVQLPANIIVLNELAAYRHVYIDVVTAEMKYGSLFIQYSTTESETKTFQYSDLKNGYVYFRWKPTANVTGGNMYVETLKGIVRVDGLAPGEFSVTLTIQAPVISPPTSTEPKPTPQPSNTGTTDSSASDSNQSQQSSLALYVPMVGLIIVVVIASVVVIGFCCSQSRHIKQKLYHKTSAINFNRTSPIQHRQSPTRPPHSPPLTGVFDQEYSDSEISTPDVMMVPGHTQHPMTTISASHTYLPHSQCSYEPISSGYNSHTSAQMGPSPTLMRHQDSPPANFVPNTAYCGTALTRNELRSSSPVRKVAASRRNTRPYASMTISGKGKNSPTRSKDYGSPLHTLQTRPQVEDSASSLGYDTSSMTQESQRLPSLSTPTPVNLESLINEENVTDLYRKTHPVLKPPQYWV